MSIYWWLWDSIRGKGGRREKRKLNINSFFSPLEWFELWFPFSKGWPSFKAVLDLTAWVISLGPVSNRGEVSPQRQKCWSVIAAKCHTAALCRSLRDLTNLRVFKWDHILHKGLSASVQVRSTEWKPPLCKLSCKLSSQWYIVQPDYCFFDNSRAKIFFFSGQTQS